MYSQTLKIPKERVPVLIGKNGETKKHIESKAGIALDIDSKEGIVIISGEDSFKVYLTLSIVKAIARGFNPDIALTLLYEDYSLELIDIQEYSRKSKNKLARLKGRVIGVTGKSKKLLEQLTHTNISVYGRTVGIIGLTDDVLLAKQAIEKLLQGARHGNVYAWVEKQRKLKKVEEYK